MILFCQVPFLLTETCGKILFFPFSDLKKQRHLTSCQFSQLEPPSSRYSIYFCSVCFEVTHFIAELFVTMLFIPCQGPPFYLLLLWGVKIFAKLPVRTTLRRGHKGSHCPHAGALLQKATERLHNWQFKSCNRGKRAVLPPCPEKCPWRYLS